MKHIKEYNHDASPIEELSEYLQEFFDKFGILEASQKHTEELISNWEVYENKIFISIVRKDSWLYRLYDFDRRRIDPPDVIEIIKYLDKIKENVEKRLGHKFYIDLKENTDSTEILITL